MTVSGKVFVVTGASRGIGLAIAQCLLSHNSRVMVIARSTSALEELAQQHRDNVEVLTGDFADQSLPRRVVAAAEARWQRLDGLIINHGVLDPVARISDSSIEDWQAAYQINLFSAVALVQAAIPALRKSKGSIILTSSGAAVKGYQGWGAYGSAKAALNHLAMNLAAEEKDIVTIAVRPGVVDTEMQRDIREKHKAAMSEQDATRFAGLKTAGELLRPEQPGNVMARLALEPPKELTGKFLSWDSDELKSFQDK